MKISVLVLLITALCPTLAMGAAPRPTATVLCSVDKREQPRLVIFGDLAPFRQASGNIPEARSKSV